MMDIEYNTQVGPVHIKEYGRNVQRMVKHLKEIEDREERNLAAQTTIKVMAQVNPEGMKGQDSDQKLWDHLFVMAEYDLDVDSPFEKPTKPDGNVDIKKPSYPKGRIRSRHYGKIVQDLIKITVAEENQEAKENMLNYLSAYMKLAYKLWNEDKVMDEVIIQNIIDMSDGELRPTEIPDITEGIQTMPKPSAHNNRNNNKRRKKKKRTPRKR